VTHRDVAAAHEEAEKATELRDTTQREMNKLKALSDAENLAFEAEWKKVAEVCVRVTTTTQAVDLSSECLSAAQELMIVCDGFGIWVGCTRRLLDLIETIGIHALTAHLQTPRTEGSSRLSRRRN